MKIHLSKLIGQYIKKFFVYLKKNLISICVAKFNFLNVFYNILLTVVFNPSKYRQMLFLQKL